MVERIPHCIRYGFRPFFEFFVAASVARDEFLRYAVSPHGSPLVVVASKPYFRQVVELVVFRYHFRYEMAVIVDDRHLFGAFVIQLPGIVVGEHEIIVDELPVHQPLDVLFYF